jgi:MFS family permease
MSATTAGARRVRPGIVFMVFAAYGVLWGSYLASIPDILAACAAATGDLTTAMLAGALASVPAMYAAGRLLDCRGPRAAPYPVALFTMAAPLPMFAGSVPELFATVTLFGFASGACNVAVLTLASSVEAELNRPLMSRAYAVFSLAVVVASIGTGVARAVDVPGRYPALLIALVVVAGVVRSRQALPAGPVVRREKALRRGQAGPVVACWLVCGLTMLIASGVQQWSAVYLSEVVGAPAALAGAGPGLFAASMMVGRLCGHWLNCRLPDRAVLVVSAGCSGLGVLLVAATSDVVPALLGFAVVGGAISIATPTTYSLIGRCAGDGERGVVLSRSASASCAGELLGPAVLGFMAGQTHFPAAMAGMAAVSGIVCLVAWHVPAGRSFGHHGTGAPA